MAVPSATKESVEKSGSSPSRSPKLDSESASETSSAHSGDTSDRRDVDIMTQVLSSRSEEYRLLFRLPPDEVLVQDFNCALQENILLQGHMYLFIHHICFYSNIFGFETKKTIPFHEVTCVRKAKTAAIFPNAIEIVTGDKKHFFGSFLSRDEAYRLIVDGWAQHNSDARVLLDNQDSKSENGQDNSIVIVERVGGTTLSADALSSAQRGKGINGLEECRPLLKESGNFSENRENGKAEDGETPSSREIFTWEVEELDAPKIPEHFTLVIEAGFPICVEDFFTLFISDSASDFLERFHGKCGDKDFQCTPWRPHEQFGHARDLSFLHPVKVYIGAKLGRCQEVQKYRVYRNSHLVIETTQRVSEVPFADYFHVERIWDVEKNNNEENSCILRVYFNVAFSKKTMFKGKIEQSTRDELRDVHGMWINNAHELLKQKNTEKLKGIDGQKTIMNRDQKEGVGSSLKLEGTIENLHPVMTPMVSAQTMALDNSVSQIDRFVQENSGFPIPVASFFRELWAALISYAKSHMRFPTYLAIVVVAILILMQISIIILLTRVPEVHVIVQGSQVDGLSGLRTENTEWLEKRIDYLKEEMLMVETRLERMHLEHGMLKAHLQSLERLKSKS